MGYQYIDFGTFSIVFGMNGVAMARHGPILNDNEAMGSGKVFKYLPGLRDTIKNQKWPPKSKKQKNTGTFDFQDLLTLAAIFEYYMVCWRSGRYLETFLLPVASL